MGMTMSEKILALEYEPEIFLWQNVILVLGPIGKQRLGGLIPYLEHWQKEHGGK